MATSLAAAQQKLIERVTNGGAARYDAAKQHMAQNYANGFSHLGFSPGPTTQAAYSQGIQRVSGSEWAQRTAAGAAHWADRYRQAMSR